MMEQRLIDANALLGKAIEEKRFVLKMEDLVRREVIIQTAYKDLADFIDSAPTVDAVEVVRCKDCKHCQYDEMFGDRWCNGSRVHADSFCSDGERRDSDG